jgi:glucosamine--fructose-6-phosphate aminotransferase (isomerizing)
MGDLNMVLPSGQEESIAQTRAFSTLYLATVALIALWNEEDYLLDELGRLPELGGDLLERYSSLAKQRGEQLSLERFYFLGSGPRYGLACELSLKMKEMTLSHSEPFHFMEFRHGPQSMVTADTLMVGLLSEANYLAESRVIEDMRARGANILAMSEGEGDVCFNSGLSEAARNVLYLPVGQLMAFTRSVQRGLDPDHPHNLDAVVRLDA